MADSSPVCVCVRARAFFRSALTNTAGAYAALPGSQGQLRTSRDPPAPRAPPSVYTSADGIFMKRFSSDPGLNEFLVQPICGKASPIPSQDPAHCRWKGLSRPFPAGGIQRQLSPVPSIYPQEHW